VFSPHDPKIELIFILRGAQNGHESLILNISFFYQKRSGITWSGKISRIQGGPRLEFNYLQMDVPLYFTTMALIEDEQRVATEKII